MSGQTAWLALFLREVDIYESCDDDELDQQLKNAQLVEPDSDRSSVNYIMHDDSEVALFKTVRTGLAPDEGRHRER